MRTSHRPFYKLSTPISNAANYFSHNPGEDQYGLADGLGSDGGLVQPHVTSEEDAHDLLIKMRSKKVKKIVNS